MIQLRYQSKEDKTMKYTIEYGNPNTNMKTVKVDNLESADRMFKKYKAFAENHNLTWVISMWGKDRFLIESIIVNPTKIHKM